MRVSQLGPTLLGVVACVGFWIAGEACVRAVGLSYGGGLVGFALLAIALRTRAVPLVRVEAGASWLVRHLAFPLVGVTANVVFEARVLATEALAIGIATSAGTILVLVGVGLGARAWLGSKKATHE